MDPALLHATLSIVALHRDLLTHHEQSVDSLMHKGQAIQAINRRLQLSQSSKDENLAIIALLIKFEVKQS
jgi:Fungal specific transcription factor domain